MDVVRTLDRIEDSAARLRSSHIWSLPHRLAPHPPPSSRLMNVAKERGSYEAPYHPFGAVTVFCASGGAP